MNTNDSDLLAESEGLFTEHYIFKRLVYVNSANHGYSEIILNHHMAMFGANNAGKTASLAGIKLLLFPETDFFKCEEKFRFEGKRGLYSTIESYEFYFPSTKSFLILESENPEGHFCMVLYKTNNYGYGRFFIPCDYEGIRHLFWNSQENHFAENLTIQAISQFSKSHQGIQTSNQKDISYLMFSSYTEHRSKKRFCLLPLKSDRIDSINAFKNIYQLAFDTGNTETQTLPKALATLLEMDRGRDEERLDTNLKQLQEQYSNLVEKQEWLQAIKNALPQYQQVEDEFKKTKAALLSYSVRFKALEQSLLRAKVDFEPQLDAIQSGIKSNKNIAEELSQTINSVENKIKDANAEVKYLKRSFKQQKSEQDQAKKLVADYPSVSHNEIMEILSEEQEKSEKAVNEYRTEGGIIQSFKKNNLERNNQVKQRDELKKLMNNVESSFLHQLKDEHSASILNSINPEFAHISTDINDEHKQILTQFTSLFSCNSDQKLLFLNQSEMNIRFQTFDQEKQLTDWQKKLEDLDASIHSLNREIDKQSDAIKHNDPEQLITQTENEIKQIKKEIRLISNIDHLEENLESQANEITDKEIDLARQNNILQEYLNDRSQINGDIRKDTIKQQELQNKFNDFKQIEKLLSYAKDSLKPIDCDPESIHEQQLSLDAAGELNKTAAAGNQLFSAFKTGMDKLILKLKLAEIDPHKEYYLLQDYENIIQTYSSIFTTLDYELKQLSNEIKSHNQLVSNQLNELKEAKNLLTNFMHAINQKLNSKHISNLSEIKLNLKINPQFESLLATLDKHNIQDDSLLGEEFYISLAKFVRQYFNKKTRRLKMHDIIESISYQYQFQETGEVVTKSQSGGTSSTITAFVLSILLKHVVKDYVALNIPIIVDEISTLDINNTDATINQIADQGFSIFCATPTFNSTVCQKVGYWVMMDQSIIKKPLVNKCHLNILPQHIESFGLHENDKSVAE